MNAAKLYPLLFGPVRVSKKPNMRKRKNKTHDVPNANSKNGFMLLESFGVAGFGQPFVFLNESNELIEVFDGPLRVTKAEHVAHPIVFRHQLAEGLDGSNFLAGLICEFGYCVTDDFGHCWFGFNFNVNDRMTKMGRKNFEQFRFCGIDFNFHIVSLPK